MRIAILLGSVREGRQTHKVTDFLEGELLKLPGVSVDLIDLREWRLPIFEDRWQKMEEPPGQLVDLSESLSKADGMIFASPEYHGSYTGVLKNAVDHYWKEFYRKPIGVIATGAGQFGGINASTEMQQLILSIGAFPMPYKLLVPNVKYAFDADDQPVENALLESMDRFVKDYLWFARAIVAAKELEAAP